jgi:hypothetical protein
MPCTGNGDNRRGDALVSRARACAPICASLGSPASPSPSRTRSLVLYRFAVAAIATGVVSLRDAARTFALIVVGEIAYGIGVGWFSLRLRRGANDQRSRSPCLHAVAFSCP